MSAHERRSRNKLAEDEDATKLKLGPGTAILTLPPSCEVSTDEYDFNDYRQTLRRVEEQVR
jgi:hypothetical protein